MLHSELATGFPPTFLNAIGRPPDVETMRMLRTDPARLLGDTIGADDINDLRHHPRTESCSIRFSIKSQEISSHSRSARQRECRWRAWSASWRRMLSLAYANGLADRPDVRGLLLAFAVEAYLFVLLDQGAWFAVGLRPRSRRARVGRSFRPIQQAIPDGRLALSTADPGFADLLHTMDKTPPLSLVPTLSLPFTRRHYPETDQHSHANSRSIFNLIRILRPSHPLGGRTPSSRSSIWQ